MKATVNLNQILQGGLAGLVAWLFKTVNDLQQEVATLKAQVSAYQDSINGFNQNLMIIEEVIREILFKVGGQWIAVAMVVALVTDNDPKNKR